MRRTIIILTLAALSAHAIDCIRATFNYILIDRSYWEFTPDNLYIDSSYSQNKSMVNTSKFYWSDTKLDSIQMHMSCRDNRKDWTVPKDWKVETIKQGSTTRYTWTEPMPMFLTMGKASLDFQIGDQHYMLYIQNDTLFESGGNSQTKRIITRDPNNESRCYRKNESGLLITTFEYEMQGSTLIQKMVEPDHNKYFRNPDPCYGGEKRTTIYYKTR
ncbi:MAG: hypothetical protein J5977_10780 [Fibrobacter sp.]|nr:hypothetical protein [Fibrobacter sp.]